MQLYNYKSIITLSFILMLQKCIFVTSDSSTNLRYRKRIYAKYVKESNVASDSVGEMDTDYATESCFSGASESINLNDNFFKKWLNALLLKMKEESWDLKDVNIVELPINGDFLMKLHTVLHEPLFTVKELDEDIVEAISGARTNNYRSRGLLYDWLGGNFISYNYPLVIVFLLVCCCVWWFLKNNLKILSAITVLILMTFWHWMKMYQQKKAEKHSVVENLIYPSECRKGELSWYEGFQVYFFGKLVGNTDCKKYYEALLVDPIWEVSLPVAFSNALSQILFEPIKELGTVLNLFFKNLYSDFSVLGAIGISIFIFIFIIIMYGYKISFFWSLLTIEPSKSITQGSLFLDTAKNCCKNVLGWKSKPEVAQIENSANKNVKSVSELRRDNMEQHQDIIQHQNSDDKSNQGLHHYFSYSIFKISRFVGCTISSVIYSKNKLFSMYEYGSSLWHDYREKTSDDSSLLNKVQAVTSDQNLFLELQDHSCCVVKEGIPSLSSNEAPFIDLQEGLFANSNSLHLYDYKQERTSDLCENDKIPPVTLNEKSSKFDLVCDDEPLIDLQEGLFANSNIHHLYDYKKERTSDLCENDKIPPITLNEKSGKFDLVCSDVMGLNCLISDTTEAQPVQKQFNTFFEDLENLDSSTNATLDWDDLGKESFKPFPKNLDSSTNASLDWIDLGKKSSKPLSENLKNLSSSSNATLDWNVLEKKSFNPFSKDLENSDSSVVRERIQSTHCQKNSLF